VNEADTGKLIKYMYSN